MSGGVSCPDFFEISMLGCLGRLPTADWSKRSTGLSTTRTGGAILQPLRLAEHGIVLVLT